MPRSDNIEAEGKVIECLPGAKFIVELPNKHKVNCTISGKIRVNNIKIIENDTVKVSISPYDLTHGIITYRNKV